MLTKSDELLCHQIVSTFDHVDTSESNWAEKMEIDVYDSSGGIVVSHGIGKYTNRNVMDGFGAVALKDRQYHVRSSRELHTEPDITKIGPVSLEVVEPFKKIRICLGENEYGFSYDLELEGVMTPFEEPVGFTRFKGKIVNHCVRYYQLCRASGKVTVEGKTYKATRDTWYAQRDHSWGIRGLMGAYRAAGGWRHPEDKGAPESGLQPNPRDHIPGYLGFLNAAEFKDFGFFTTYVEGPDGKPFQLGLSGIHGYIVYPYAANRSPQRIVNQQYQIQFFPGARQLKSLKVDFTLEDGTNRQISMRPMGVGTYTFAVGYFGGYRNWWHGKWMGPSWVQGEKIDITNENVLGEMFGGGLKHATLECRCGDEVGYGVIQYGAFGELPKYGIKASGS
ncbi:MAG: hypothetical protein WC749_02920 [Dehalococcoidia bacterium]